MSEGQAKHLYLYVIHTQHLKHRAIRIHGYIQQLRIAAMSKGFEVKPILVLSPDPTDIGQRMNEVQSKITYDAINDTEFDGQRQMLTTEILSNLEKHKDAWRRIAEVSADVAKHALFMIMEDDSILLPESIPNFVSLLDLLSAPVEPWDIVVTGIAQPQNPAAHEVPQSLVPLANIGTSIIPCKDSYFIQQNTAARFLETLNNEKYRYSARVQLSWLIHKVANPVIRAFHPANRITLDGSKIGVCPSALHPNNVLIFNREYMELMSYLQKDQKTIKTALPQIRSIFKGIQHLQSPDIMHLYGVLLFKAGNIGEAEEMMSEAMMIMKAHSGVLNSRSDLMNNLIQIYQHLQPDLPSLVAEKSVYDDEAMARPTYG